MSNPIQSVPTPTGEFQAHFGGPPGSSDLAADCKKWENLCGELLAERQRLREDLAKTQSEREQYLKSLYHLLCKDYVCPYTKEELFANAIFEPTMEEIIAELERDKED
jgi:hypothetical protein